MRLCRYEKNGTIQVGFYDEARISPLQAIASQSGVTVPQTDSLLAFLPGGEFQAQAKNLATELDSLSEDDIAAFSIPTCETALKVPVPNPEKILLLAGNYAEHIEEGGGRSEERARTFPYVFMKPPSTTLTNPGDPVIIPTISPDCIDWELELGVVIGKRCKVVSQADSLDYVAGYTVVNDISNRKYRPNPQRAERPKDKFFDWLHGKWHDTFCPMGPCVLPADEVDDPQSLKLTLKLNDEIEQDSSTSQMVFPVAAIVSFISQLVTLEPGDVISTGTPSGVGFPKGKFLKPGDMIEAEIGSIGILRNPVEAESAGS